MREELNLDRTVQILKKVLASDQDYIALHEPSFNGNEWTYIKKCLDSGWVSSAGQYVELFEQKLAEFVGVKHAAAVVNGTSALHLALKIVGVGAEDEVLIPALTFVATANAVSYCGAVPHFVDNEERTLGLDPEKLCIYLDGIADLKPEGCCNKITGRRIKAFLDIGPFIAI
ncbi:MAG TPA: aminotransferase class I/II-fold pyridoxal phosphate-dependent enzyme, partial [Syntrophomonadaceae bacterium]|nr:aminotransferase class I/II-fold pyridoxal phosphate-dependent enzyme [Syntrophomonadaceae bacterium]